MAYNTGNAPGSTHPKDLIDNAEDLDYLMTGGGASNPNRLGVPLKSWKGMEGEFSAAQANKEERFQQFLLSSGYQPIGGYGPGLLISERNQIFLKDGEYYRASAALSLPYTTTGVWASESSKFVSVGDAALRQELAAPLGSSMLGHLLNATGAMPRAGSDKLNEMPSVKDFGPAGTGNGVTSDHLAALAMGAALGFIHFSRGNYVLDTCALGYPVSFAKKANVTSNAGQVVTITAEIESPKQFIFKGAGDYVLTQLDSGAGENVREIHASWFGAFPSVVNAGDTAPAFAKAFAAMGNARESIVHCDIGGYVISSQAAITRGGWLKGAGSRRTVFKFNGDGYIGFIDTVSGLAKISDCNFELIPGTVTNRLSPFVQFNGNESEFYNVRLGETAKGFVVTGNSSKIYNIAAAYGADKGAGSDVIHIKGGNGHIVDKVNLATSAAFGPEAIVRVGGVGAGGINDVNISSIYHMTPSVSVVVEAVSDNISGVIIDGVQYNGFSGTPPAQVVRLSTAGTASLADVIVDKIQGSSRSLAMVTLQQGSTTFMHRINVNNVQDKRTDGNGIELIQTAGVLEEVDIGSGVQLKTRTNPIFRSGTLGAVRIAPGVEKGSIAYIARAANIADDGVLAIDLGKSVFSAIVKLSSVASSTINYGDYAVRAAASPVVAVINQSATMATATTALTGTTGVDGKITLGVTNGILYIENRSGVAINVAVGITG